MKIEDMTPKQKIWLDELLSLQAHLMRKAEVVYMCYYLKISEAQFWERFMWSKMSKLHNPFMNRKTAEELDFDDLESEKILQRFSSNFQSNSSETNLEN